MRARVTSLVAAGLLGLALAVPAAAAPGSLGWHRLNPPTEDVAAEHERLTCTEAGSSLRCVYDKLPDPVFHFDTTTGTFHGHDVTARWACPDWFDPAICESVVTVWAGPATYDQADGTRFRVPQEYVVTEEGVLYQHWVGQFACPWYGTFDEAVDANPTAEFDCLVP